MDILILGGTVFLGRHLVVAAQARGHRVTLFHRGRHGVDLFPDVERILGDRGADLSGLTGRHWDAVIDTSGYVPRVVRASAEVLRDRVGRYAFVSSVSAYADLTPPGIDESAPVGRLEDPTTEAVTGETYGPLKALCEQAVRDVCGDRALVLRPGLIVGPHDPTDRFTYWPRRLAAGGPVLAPEPRDGAVQFIDARDLADWTIRLLEAGAGGTFNAIGPAEPTTMAEFLEAGRAAVGPQAELVWADADWLLGRGVQPGWGCRCGFRRAGRSGCSRSPTPGPAPPA